MLIGGAAVIAVAGPGAGAMAEGTGGEAPRSTETAAGLARGARSTVEFELPDDPGSRVLKERVEARWQALVDRDFEAAYAYESPAFREKTTPGQYKSRFGPNVKWHMATVKRIRYDQRGAAKVLVEIDHDFFPPQGDQPIRSQAYLEEDWVNIDGHWWRNATQNEFVLPTD